MGNILQSHVSVTCREQSPPYVKSPVKLQTPTKKKEAANRVKVSLEIIKAGEELMKCGRVDKERQLLRGKSHSQLMVGAVEEDVDRGGQQNMIDGQY